MDVLYKSVDMLREMFHGGLLAISGVLGIILTALGHPKDILILVFVLVCLDLVTRWYAEVLKLYGRVTFFNFFGSWINGHLNSKKMIKGFAAKLVVYIPILYIAHQLSCIDEVLYGALISSGLYSLLCLVEGISIAENMVDSGANFLQPVLTFFKNKQTSVVGSPPEDAPKTTKQSDDNIPTI